MGDRREGREGGGRREKRGERGAGGGRREKRGDREGGMWMRHAVSAKRKCTTNGVIPPSGDLRCDVTRSHCQFLLPLYNGLQTTFD